MWSLHPIIVPFHFYFISQKSENRKENILTVKIISRVLHNKLNYKAPKSLGWASRIPRVQGQTIFCTTLKDKNASITPGGSQQVPGAGSGTSTIKTSSDFVQTLLANPRHQTPLSFYYYNNINVNLKIHRKIFFFFLLCLKCCYAGRGNTVAPKDMLQLVLT